MTTVDVDRFTVDRDVVPEGYEFALCLTHDVDRPYKTFQSVYYAVTERDLSHLSSLAPGTEPYWQFDTVAAIEDRLGVRSAFYFLSEQRLFDDRPPGDWVDPVAWRLYAGRYALSDPAIADVVERLHRRDWEVGLHGSYESYADPERLKGEKATLERTLGHPVRGGRQHYLNLEVPDTWRYHARLGLRYDASLGSSDQYGFDHGYGVLRPFDDGFVVFPLTLMETALPDPGETPAAAWHVCESLLEEAATEGAVMTVLFHPRYFNGEEFPGYRTVYERLIRRAVEMDAWVGPPARLYDHLDHPSPRDEGDDRATATGPEERNPGPTDGPADPPGPNR